MCSRVIRVGEHGLGCRLAAGQGGGQVTSLAAARMLAFGISHSLIPVMPCCPPCFQGEVFDQFLKGDKLEECYVANRWLDMLDTRVGGSGDGCKWAGCLQWLQSSRRQPLAGHAGHAGGWMGMWSWIRCHCCLALVN